jgi:hypothetical protein
LCCNVAAIIAGIILPESPKYLYGAKRFDETRKTFKFISILNGAKTNCDFKFDMEIE